MKYYKIDYENNTVREVMGDPWPGKDQDGEVVYDNTHFESEGKAWAAMLKKLNLRLQFKCDNLKDIESETNAIKGEIVQQSLNVVEVKKKMKARGFGDE